MSFGLAAKWKIPTLFSSLRPNGNTKMYSSKQLAEQLRADLHNIIMYPGLSAVTAVTNYQLID